MLRLKQVRMERQVSQKELASVLGIGISSLSQYENGKRQPDFQIVSKFADYFGVTVDYLLGREGQTSSSPDEKTASTPVSESERKQSDETELLTYFRQFNREGRGRMLDFAESMQRSGKYAVGANYFAQ